MGGACGLGRMILPNAAISAAEEARKQPFASYADLLGALERRGHKLRKLGVAPDQSPIVAVRAGGKKTPAIFISAGSHATEHAGVLAAVELADQLKTEHEVWILPTRDPIGLSGYRYALSRGLGQAPDLNSLASVEALLRKEGEVLFEDAETLLVLIGEIGYANRGLYRKVEKGAKFLAPLHGRRIYFPSRSADMPGAEPLARAYTLVVTPEGEVLHLNRFHDTPWAPAEVRCARRLMAEIKPGLTFDLHEHEGGGFFWMSARRQRTDADEMWEQRMAGEGIRAVAAAGAELAPETYSPGTFFERRERGVYWLHPGQRGEGLNLIDFAANTYGPGFTVETGMRGPLAQRVEQHLTVVQAAVKVFEARHA